MGNLIAVESNMKGKRPQSAAQKPSFHDERWTTSY